MKKYRTLSCVLLLLLSGCGIFGKKNDLMTPEEEREIPNHVISVGSDGELKSYLPLNKIVEKIKEFAKNKEEAEVLLFIHGGLNSEDKALERARKIYKKIPAKGIYPVFVIWNSEGFSSYWDHLFKIRQGEESNTAWSTSPFYFLTDVGNTIVNAPKAWLITGEHMVDTTLLMSVPSKKRFIPIPSVGDKDEQLNKEINYFNNTNIYSEPTKSHKKNFARGLSWLLTSPGKLVTTPFAYTLAKPAWDIMLRRTNTLFYTPADLKLEETVSSNYISPKRNKPGSGALYSFLEKLKPMSNIKLTLVGHSMGAIVVDKIIMLEPTLHYKNIVHLASADSINNLFNTVIPYLADKENECKTPGSNCEIPKFYSMMLHPDNEDREQSAYGLIPSGSLLTYIDSMYTTPETVLDRRSGVWDNIKYAIPYIPEDAAKNMHFKIAGINKEDKCDDDDKDCIITSPQKHGDFDATAFWEQHTWWKQTDQ